jgi:hypothetical protein
MDTRAFNQPEFIHAITDYYYLLNNGYPEKGTIKLIGDRYSLSGEMRTLLFRGIATRKNNLSRQFKKTSDLQGKDLIIDGYNVLLTLLNYKLGKLVFISTDGFCRDAGSLFGRIKNQKSFEQVLEQLFEFLSGLKPYFVRIYFDSPVSFSGEHKCLAERIMNEKTIAGEVQTVHSVDSEIIKNKDGIICTSDSAVIDNTNNRVADLALLLIRNFYKPQLLNLSFMLSL